MNKEKVIRNQIMNELGKDPTLWVLSNPSGVAEYTDISTGKSYKVSYGLGGIDGGPDLIVIVHWRHSRMIYGNTSLGIEVKRPGEEPRDNQKKWRRAAAMRGMRVEPCDSVEKALKLVQLVKHELELCGLIACHARPAVFSIPG